MVHTGYFSNGFATFDSPSKYCSLLRGKINIFFIFCPLALTKFELNKSILLDICTESRARVCFISNILHFSDFKSQGLLMLPIPQSCFVQFCARSLIFFFYYLPFYKEFSLSLSLNWSIFYSIILFSYYLSSVVSETRGFLVEDSARFFFSLILSK